MNLNTLHNEEYSIIAQQTIAGKKLIVKQTSQYRWFEYGGKSIQSVMHRTAVERIISPIYQSLLLFVLWEKRPIHLLNLGLGGASIERALNSINNIQLTAVESSPEIIEVAKYCFHLPEKVEVYCHDAQLFIQQTNKQYNIILCDLFIADKSPAFLFTPQFYCNLSKITSSDAFVFINLQADSEQHLLNALLAIKKQFLHVALIEFDNYVNIVIVCSQNPIPEKHTLKLQLENFDLINFSCMETIIEKIRYI